MPVKISRKCIPYTPFRKELSEATLAIVSMAGVYVEGQRPFDLENDVTYRVIPGDAATSDLRIAHQHYDHTDADRDPNIMLPLDRARDLVTAGLLAGVNDKHYSLGYVQDLRVVYDQVAPEIADALYQSKTDVVLLTAG